eukprot:6430220-Amphidinium_carterae.1
MIFSKNALEKNNMNRSTKKAFEQRTKDGKKQRKNQFDFNKGDFGEPLLRWTEPHSLHRQERPPSLKNAWIVDRHHLKPQRQQIFFHFEM